MLRTKRSQTFGELIRVVSGFSHDDLEMSLVIADLIQRGVVKLNGVSRPIRIVAFVRPAMVARR
jgi:hypothetical protein